MKSGAWTILVIDDSPEDRAEVRQLLLKGSDRRYHFIEAGTGAAGLREALAALPDCVVLDYNLPDADAPKLRPFARSWC
jgi:CheY-like chemotaxis protein